MIVLYHNNLKVMSLETSDDKLVFATENIVSTLFAAAEQYPDQLLIWCHISQKENLNARTLDEIFHHKKIVASYNTAKANYLSDAIGYVEESPFIQVNKEVSYPTWQLSTDVGGVYAAVLLAIKNSFPLNTNFAYFLQSFAKLAMPLGIFCYSEPSILKQHSIIISERSIANTSQLFKFVKEHYRTRWLFLLMLNLFVYEKRIPLFSFFKALFYKKRTIATNAFDSIAVQSSRKVFVLKTIDVIIPTIGRKKYLYDVLVDLKNQTHLPQNVIIIEQNPKKRSSTELDYLKNEAWPFTIKHTFTQQAGACNARNIALSQVESEWVFMADDDIRIESDFIKKAILSINIFGINTVTFGCYEEKYPQNKKNKQQQQWSSFGSGCSIVKNNFTENSRYRKGFEFGYGEDSDYGMQLRSSGADVLYFPNPEILHLKAPIGGFRTKPILDWANDVIQPKPSPTVMLFKQLHLTKEQINGYRTILFFKFYSVQKIKNPIRYFINFKKQWSRSLFWSNQLMNKE